MSYEKPKPLTPEQIQKMSKDAEEQEQQELKRSGHEELVEFKRVTKKQANINRKNLKTEHPKYL